jgi:hypothetical protein
MKTLWNREPAAILGALQAILALVISFGLNLSGGQIGAIYAASAAILAVVVRSQVTPNASVPVVVPVPAAPQVPPVGGA